MNLLSNQITATRLISPRDGFRIGMGFKIIHQRGIKMMVYGYSDQERIFSTVNTNQEL